MGFSGFFFFFFENLTTHSDVVMIAERRLYREHPIIASISFRAPSHLFFHHLTEATQRSNSHISSANTPISDKARLPFQLDHV